jgi:hypothetical protein
MKKPEVTMVVAIDGLTVGYNLREFPTDVIDYVVDQLPDRLTTEMPDIIADTEVTVEAGVISVEDPVLNIIYKLIEEKQADLNCKSERAETTGVA